MGNKSGEFPFGKAAAIVTLLALVFLPVVSCGPIEFKGHELLRNKVPDFSGALDPINESLGKVSRSMRGEKDGDGAGEKEKAKPEREHIFAGSEAWMHWLYIAVLAAALATLFLRGRARAWVGGLGAAGLILFLERFQTALVNQSDKADDASSKLSMFEWDMGAYVAMLGFVVVVVDGLRSRRAATPRAAPPES